LGMFIARLMVKWFALGKISLMCTGIPE